MRAFLFTDIEGSTRLWEEHESDMPATLAAHDQLIESAVLAHDGIVFKHTGDGAGATFDSAVAACRAAVDAQVAIRDADWGSIGRLRVRMGIHVGEAEHRDGDYFGRAVNKTARLMDAANGGQVVLSALASTLLANLATDISVRDLGLHQLKDLVEAEHVMQLCHLELETDFAPLSSVSRVPRNLPALAESFLGREDELGFLRSMLEKSRFVTLTGTGGVGKTQLAIAMAERSIDRRPDGAWFCDGGSLRTSEGIARRLNTILSIDNPSEADPIERLLSGIATKRLTIILDNLGHAPGPVGDVIVRLLDHCPNIHLICTSRSVLGVRGEQTMTVNPLPIPADDQPEQVYSSPAVELFEQRAREANPYFRLGNDNSSAVAQICRRLDGLPLAVELAAALMDVVGPAELSNQLDDDLGLIDDRSRTLHEVVAMSYESLSDDERRLFRRLGVFHGGFSFRAAAQMCSDDANGATAISLLGGLVRKSVVFVDTQWTGPGTRYRMLSLLRDFAREQLQSAGELPETLDNHVAICLADARRANAQLLTSDEGIAALALAADLDNLRAAHRYAIETEQTATALAIVAATARFALQSTRYELCDWAEESLRQPNARVDMAGTAAAQTLCAVNASISGDLDAARTQTKRAVATAENLTDEELGFALETHAKTAILVNDVTTVVEACERFARLDPSAQGAASAMASYRSLVGSRAEKFADSKAAAADAVDAARRTGCPTLQAISLYAAAAAEEDPDKSIDLLSEATEHASAVENRFLVVLTLQLLTWKQARSGGGPDTRVEFERVISYWYRLANWTNLEQSLKMMVESLADSSDAELLATVAGWLDQRAENAGTVALSQSGSYPTAVRSIRSRIGTEAFNAATKRGRSSSVSDIVDLCRSELIELS